MRIDLAALARLRLYELRNGAKLGYSLLNAAQIVSLPWIHLGLRLDLWRHPEIAEVPVRKPVFVVGNPRSGTTFLHHLLDADPRNACPRTLDLVLPSPTLRACVPDRLVRYAARAVASRFRELQAVHPVGLDRLEEDEILFMLLGNSGVFQLLFPHGPELESLRMMRFWEWPREQRDGFGGFLRGFMQRLLHERAGAERYVGKSPHFSAKVDDLNRWFPDARFVYLVRSPLETIPSGINLAQTLWRLSARPSYAARADAIESLYRTFVTLYRRAHESLDRLPSDRVAVVRYPDLVAEPRKVVESLYGRFGFDVPPELHDRLEGKWTTRPSGRSYRLADYGLSEDRIRRDLGFVLERHAL